MIALPVFYFPTTIVCVDDDPTFLDGLKVILGNNYNVITFSDVDVAFNEFRNYKSPIASVSFLQSLVEHEYYDAPNHAPINLNMSYLQKLSNLSNKIDEISILIVDYDMPKMNGLEFCAKLFGTPFKKILLTGFVDQQKAISAFNNKLIDGFITKDDSNLLKSLTDSINLLDKQYFFELTNTIRNNLETSRVLPLSDDIFIKFFTNWLLENQIKEYYLIDKNGSFLMIDKFGLASYFIIHTDSSLNSLIQIYHEDEQLTSFTKSIVQRQKIPFFGHSTSAEQVNPDLWVNYLYSPKTLDGRERYYWCNVSVNQCL